MARVRKDVWQLPANDKTLFWYGEAIKVLQAKPITDITSWWSLAAMHGIDKQLWIDLGYLDASVALPFDPDAEGFWNQCQHGSWYFLPWHRAYLAAFEAILLDAIVKKGGPADWALPYWNYDPTKRDTLKFPAAFAPELLDDGSKNPLWVKERYGRTGNGSIVILKTDVAVGQLWQEPEFFDGPGDIPTSFGGTQTAFSHGGTGAGLLEQRPHGPVHVLVGGTKEGTSSDILKNNGLMAMFETAGIDPIFWLHHANIDRLWESWLTARHHPQDPPDAYKNPTDTDWLDQPAGQFVMPRPDGTTFTTTARQVLNTKDPALNYEYQDIAIPGQRPLLVARLNRLGVAPADANQLAGALAMASRKSTELVGQTSTAVRIAGAATDASVQLDSSATSNLTASLSVRPQAAPGAAPQAPDRVYLALENITSTTDAGVFNVYVNLPKGANPAEHPENLAGVVSLFGARAASKAGGPHAGAGMTQTLEITDIVDAMHLKGELNTQTLDVKFVPQTPITANSKVDVGRVRIYRQTR
ncbi:tyrosinase family protein [Bradyrhizobium sp. Ai1a-2]|uniref:tyrosinase family protein n=1 Tax=Bradyrhizobium sp. Ai1a-2 TaxID=196490 RepID=UPI000420E5D3|nr:tyrosinase family protein [Bradyrhizobium sp. Ai1a-2]